MARQVYLTGSSKMTYEKVFSQQHVFEPGSSLDNHWQEFISKITSYTGSMEDFIVAMNLAYIAGDASKLLTSEIVFNSTLNPEQLKAHAYRGGHYDIKFILTMWLSLPDIRYMIKNVATQVNCTKVNKYLIYITKGIILQNDDGTTIPMSKGKFIEAINEAIRLGGVDDFEVKVHSSLTQECNILIADQDRNTSSCDKARRWGTPILTSAEFLKLLGGESSEHQ